MKIYKYFLVVALAINVSCDYSDTNIDPDNPSDVPINLLLPGATAQLAYSTGGDAARFAGVFTNQLTAKDFLQPVENYSFVADRAIDSFWSSMYSTSLIGYRDVILKAEESEANHYSAIAKISTAYTLGLCTSFWGDIPYTDSMKGLSEGIIHPTYDSQESIYEDILTLLEQSIDEIDATSPLTAPTPGADDLIFQGDMDKWRAVANTLRARFEMHLIKRNGTAAYQNVLDALAEGAIADNDGDMQWVFGEEEDFNPVFNFSQSRAGSLFIDNNFVNLMNGQADPRRDFFFISDAFGVSSLPGRYVSSTNSVVNMVSYAESKFLEAEAVLFIDGVSEAEPIFAEALRASIEKVVLEAIPATEEKSGVDAISQSDVDDFIAANGTFSGLTLEEAHEKLMTQKYLALFLNPEVWNDYRRTGLPDLEPNTGSQIPVRIYYPNIEFLNNPNLPQPNPGIYDAFWRDK